jgi:cytochrome b pre-mRNA-processing protein 3
MSENYIYIYNNLINFTRNKDLYKSLGREDNFSDRLTLFLLHFAFFLKNFKNEDNTELFYRKFMILTLGNSSLVLEK